MFDRYYGLDANPFQLTPDARFYFESGTHRKALSYLGYGLAQGEGFIVITGEIGSGKTTLVGHLMATIDRSRLTAASIVSSALDAKDMVHMAAESFDIETRGLDKAATLKAIEHFLHDEARAGRRCLLVVDEAQNLNIEALEELRMLSNFQLGGQALLQTFLLGQPEFRDVVHNEPRLEQLRQRVIASHHLEAMERAEIEPYVIHRLSKVGWTGRPDITPEAMDRLYEETGGMPRKLNNLLSRLLLMGAVEQTDMLDLAMLEKVLADRAGEGDRQAPTIVQPDIPQQDQLSPVDDISQDSEAAMPDEAAVAECLPDQNEDGVEVVVKIKEAPASSVSSNISEIAASPYVAEASMTAELQNMEHRMAALEKRVAAQEDAIKQILSMLIDWAENGAPFAQDRSNAA